MTIQRFESWLAGLDRLSDAQWSQLHTVVQERSEAGAALAAIELQVDSERRCRHCHGGGAVRLGLSRGLWRYCCKRCGKTFNALTGTALSGSHNMQRWLTLGHLLVTRESVRQSAQRCGVAVTTAFRYRHRFPQQTGQLAGRLDGLVEAEETYLLHSCKGHGQPARNARRRGGRASKRGLSKQQVPVLLTTTRGGATAGQVLQTVSQASLPAALEPLLACDAVLLSDGGRAYPGSAGQLGVQHEAVNASAGRRVRGSHHIQTINNRHQQWKQLLRPFRGGGDEVSGQLPALVSASRIGTRGVPSSLLGASMVPQCLRFANSALWNPHPLERQTGVRTLRAHVRYFFRPDITSSASATATMADASACMDVGPPSYADRVNAK